MKSARFEMRSSDTGVKRDHKAFVENTQGAGGALLACVQQHAQGSAYLSQGFTDGSKGEIAG